MDRVARTALLVLLTFATDAVVAGATVRKEHPRIFFTDEVIAQVKKNVAEVALAAKAVPGQAAQLSEGKRERLTQLLEEGARKQGYRTELCTVPPVAELILVNFGVHYHPAHGSIKGPERSVETGLATAVMR